MSQVTSIRPFANIPTTVLFAVVKRNQYARFGSLFGNALDRELAVRRVAERRINHA